MLADLAAQRGRSVKLVKFETMEQAQKAPAPFTACSLFFDGRFITNEILSEKKFLQFMYEH